MTILKFGKGNAKLSKKIATFSLPAGWACPFAKDCQSRSDRITGKVTDGKHCKFRCFSASDECRKTVVRNARWFNFELLQDCVHSVSKTVELIRNSLPVNQPLVRLHVSGDFFTENYFLAWLETAWKNPQRIFYTYTKSLLYWAKHIDSMPINFRLTASYGGKNDELIKDYNLRSARVVFSEQEASDLGLELDHQDDHAFAVSGKPFALLLHGTQPAGTQAVKAWWRIMKAGKGYNVVRRKELEKVPA